MLTALRRLLFRRSAPASPSSITTDHALFTEVRTLGLTYLSEAKLGVLVHHCRRIAADGVPGDIIEAGCALGGSTVVLGRVKEVERPLKVYDVFGMIPPPTADDPPEVHDRYKTIVEGKSSGIGGNRYYGYETDLMSIVTRNLEQFGMPLADHRITLIKGLLQETMHLNGPVALAHVDVDWYDPVKTSLERLFPLLPIGGVIVLDDYFAWGGCKKATDEYLAQVPGQYSLDDTARSMTILRTREA